MRVTLRGNRYSDEAREGARFNMIRTPAGVLQAIPLFTGRSVAHVEEDTPPWQSVTARNFYAMVGALLGPLVFVACAFAAWALTAEMNWTSEFLVTDGLFSHWMVWAMVALILRFCSSALLRAGVRQ